MKKGDPHSTTTDLVWAICYLRSEESIEDLCRLWKAQQSTSDLEFLLLSIHTAVVPGGFGGSEVLSVVLTALLLVPAAAA